MKRNLFCFAFLLAFVSVTNAGNHVLELTDSDFKNKLEVLDIALVMFYAPWCGHCKRLKPEFEKAASMVKDDDPPIALARVDCTEAGKDTCNDFSVSGYPTLKIFKNGVLSPTDYNGPREANGIVKYMRAQAGPSSKELKTESDFESFISKEDAVIVGFFAPRSSKLEKVFLRTAEKMREQARFGHTSNADVLKKASQKEDTVVLYRPKFLENKFEDSVVVYDGSVSIDDIQKWVAKNYHGLCGIRTQENSKDFQHPFVVVYYNVDYKKNPKGTNYWRNRVLQVAQKYKDDFTFAISNRAEFSYDLNEYAVEFDPTDKPIATAKDASGLKYMMSGEFSVEAFEKFVKKLKAGKLEPFIRSEPLPESNDGRVKIAVGENFNEVVLDNEKDIFIEFYAPWCGHCKKLAPLYDALGEKLKDEEGVAVVKIDATKNDIPQQFQVRGYPTLMWLPKGDKKNPQRYEGEREVDAMLKYIAENASSELKGYDRKGNAKKTEL